VKIPGIGLIFSLLEEENRLPWTPGMQRGISLELALQQEQDPLHLMKLFYHCTEAAKESENYAPSTASENIAPV
jgi:hypothetical protein